ncbi:MAG: hypothetical protein ACOYOK_06365 [Pseudobdellovibrionaceae bacterium]
MPIKIMALCLLCIVQCNCGVKGRPLPPLQDPPLSYGSPSADQKIKDQEKKNVKNKKDQK